MTQQHKTKLLSGVRSISPPRDHVALPPLAVTVPRACELSGFGQTSISAFLKTGRLAAVRLPGVRRTLVSYDSLRRLLAMPSEPQPPPAEGTQPRARRLGRKGGPHEPTTSSEPRE